MPKLIIYHGSDHIITNPLLKLGKVNNDFGQGFYCTKSTEMAKEWACKSNKNGFVNSYELETDNLKILNLLENNHTVLNWIAILLEHRTFTIQDQIAKEAKNYIIDNFSININDYDIVIGYRADDSYFSYAQSFISNTLPLSGLKESLKLGNLGEQIVIVSEKAFNQIKYLNNEFVEKEIYYEKFKTRDENARMSYNKNIKNNISIKDDIFVMDILRGELKNDDPRLQ